MSTTYHVHIPLRDVLMRWKASDWRNCCHDANGRKMSQQEVKAAFLDELARGHEVIPVGAPCEGFSFKTGCPGHEEER